MTTTAQTVAKTVAPKTVKTVSDFNAILAKASKAQMTANALWHEAQKLAVYFAGSADKNLEPANRMIKAIFECKSLRVMSFVKFMLHLAGGEEKGSITWDAEEMKLGYKRKGAAISEDMQKYSDLTPFWEHSPEKITPIVAFQDVIAAVKKVRTKADKGQATITHEELALLAQIEGLICKMNPTAFEKKSAKK